MDERHVNVLVATSHSLLVLNHESGVARVVERNPDLSYHGIAFGPQAIYVAVRDRSCGDGGRALSACDGRILVYDYDLAPREALCAPFPMRDLHQIDYFRGNLYATCSYDNMIAVHDGAAWSRWYPVEERDRDVNHFNSLYFRGNTVSVLAHNNDRGSSEVYRFDVETRKLLQRFPLGRQAHNLWMRGGAMYTCDSAHGRIGRRGKETVAITGGFPRGIAVTKQGAVVGISELAERHNRDFTNGQLQVYGWGWRLKRRIMLEREGMVHDVRAPGVSDLCLPHAPRIEITVPAHLPTVQFSVEEGEGSPLLRLPAWLKAAVLG
jgi:hypothetical protein